MGNDILCRSAFATPLEPPPRHRPSTPSSLLFQSRFFLLLLRFSRNSLRVRFAIHLAHSSESLDVYPDTSTEPLTAFESVPHALIAASRTSKVIDRERKGKDFDPNQSSTMMQTTAEQHGLLV